MKLRLGKALPLVTIFAVGTALPAYAADFWDTAAVNVTTKGGVSSADGLINGSNVKGSWNDTNSNGKLDSGETVSFLDIYDRDGAKVLSAPPGATRSQLQAWGEANATAIFSTLFPAGLSEVSGASDDNMMASSTVSQNLFTKTVVKTQVAQTLNSDVKGQLEYLDLKVDGNSGRASSMVLGYSKESDSGANFSVTLPYRYSSIKDQIDTKSHFVGLDLSLKYPVKKWDKGDWKVGGAVFGSAYYLKTTNIENSGNLKYGAGLFTSATNDLGFGTLGVGLDYRIAKAYLPSSMNSDNVFLEKAVDYVNGLDPVHTVSYGFNLGVPVAGDKAAVNLEVLRSNYISSDIPDGQKNKTSVSLSGSYFPSDSFELNLGVRYDFELDNVKTLGVMLGVVHPF